MINIFKVLVPCSPMRYNIANKLVKGMRNVLSVDVPDVERVVKRVYMDFSATYTRTRKASIGTLFRKARY